MTSLQKEIQKTKHMLLKTIHVGFRICFRICEIMLKKYQKWIIYKKNTADRIANADKANIFQF